MQNCPCFSEGKGENNTIYLFYEYVNAKTVCDRCFHMDLESGTLDSLKAVVRKSCPDGMTDNGSLNSKGTVATW